MLRDLPTLQSVMSVKGDRCADYTYPVVHRQVEMALPAGVDLTGSAINQPIGEKFEVMSIVPGFNDGASAMFDCGIHDEAKRWENGEQHEQ